MRGIFIDQFMLCGSVVFKAYFNPFHPTGPFLTPKLIFLVIYCNNFKRFFIAIVIVFVVIMENKMRILPGKRTQGYF